MLTRALVFLTGISALQLHSDLPEPHWLAVLFPVLLGLWISRARVLAWLVIGYGWAWLHASLTLLPGLEPVFEGSDILLEGIVAGIPESLTGGGYRFPLALERFQGNGVWHEFRGKVRLSWYRDSPELGAGERWRLLARLKRPHGFLNPGGFDYERWLFARRIRATGYVRKDPRNRLLGRDEGMPVARLRQHLSGIFDQALPDNDSRHIIRALAMGDRTSMTPVQWEVLRATGTSHLMAISGLHISLVAGMVFWLVRASWARAILLSNIIAAPRAAAILALLAATAYAMAAGFSIPTRRALVMVAIIMTGLACGRQAVTMHGYGLAMLVVLVLDPASVLTSGFWLSFSAVGILFYVMTGRKGKTGWWWKWGRVHVFLSIGLAPLLLLLFQQASLVSPLANLIAVPWIGTLVVPVSLSGLLLHSLSAGLGNNILQLAGGLIELFWPLLETLAASRSALWEQHAPSVWALVIAMIGMFLLLAPRGLPARWTGILFLLPLFTISPPSPPRGEAWFTLLDVGQGLAAVIRTRRHVLVYDTGPRFSAAFDTGKAVIAPFLQYHGIHHIHSLIVSHGDNDHIGGARSLYAAISIDSVQSGSPEKLSWADAAACKGGDAWVWDDVSFRILHPPASWQGRGNDASCVLRIETPDGQRLLLTGDIESGTEKRLLEQAGEWLETDILVVPHHGSRTSSSARFVRAVNPRYALVPAGYRNRYGFPADEVLARYADIGASVLNTASDGAISLKLGAGVIRPRSYRLLERSYWNHPGSEPSLQN